MIMIKWLIAGILMACSVAFAQEPNLYNGTWRASIVSKEGPVREGTVILNDQGGIWNFANQSVKNPCVGILSPIVIKRATADKLVFEIKSSEALEGCRDNVAILKRVNETTLEGRLNDGRKLSLIRK